MNPESTDLSPKQSSALQVLALSNIEEGMGHNVTRAQGLQEELAQRRASLLQDSAEAQALKGQEELLAEIVEEEMAHQMQVSVLSHLHLRQAEEIKAQSNEIKRLSTLLGETAKPPEASSGASTTEQCLSSADGSATNILAE